MLDVRRGHRKLVIMVETDAERAGCRRCGVVATGQGRRWVEAADALCFGFRCGWSGSEAHELIAPRGVLTGWVIAWATDDTTVLARARRVRVGWPCGG